jgi:phage recombination protein Bet
MTALTTTTPGNDWEQILPTIRHMYANGATDPEFKIFCETARLLGLNPVLRQVWCVKNLNRPDLPAQIYASRDGLLAVAHRSGQFDGMESGVMKDETGEIVGAFCRIWRKDMTHPFSVEILRAEYDSGRSLWKDKPATMCVKVAEAHCLRRAFDISGVYTPDEMPEPEPVIREVPDTSTPAKVRVQPKVVKVQIEPKAMTKKQPAEKCHSPGKTAPVDPTKCAQCGIPQEEAPGGWLVVADDGRRVCATCRNAGAQAELQVEKTPEIGAGFVCEECAKQLTNSEQKASKMLLSRALCKDCMQKWTAEEGIGA